MPCVWGYWVVAHIVAATATGFNSICPNKLNHTREDDQGEGAKKKLASHCYNVKSSWHKEQIRRKNIIGG